MAPSDVTEEKRYIGAQLQTLGPQNPTPICKLVRAGNRLTRVSQLHYIPRIQLRTSVWLMGEVVLGLPSLGVVGFGLGALRVRSDLGLGFGPGQCQFLACF